MKSMDFDEFVKYGLKHPDNPPNVQNGMPWSFKFYGCHVTHENNDHYIICTKNGQISFRRGEQLDVDYFIRNENGIGLKDLIKSWMDEKTKNSALFEQKQEIVRQIENLDEKIEDLGRKIIDLMQDGKIYKVDETHFITLYKSFGSSTKGIVMYELGNVEQPLTMTPPM